MSYLYNGVPIMPGAYLVNGASNTQNELFQLPIFGSVSILSDMGFQNQDDAYYVLPGYKLVIYPDNNFGGTITQTLDNTSGTKIMYSNTASFNNAQSVKLYYKNEELSGKYTYSLYTNNSGSTTTTPTSNNTNGPYKLLNMPIFPGAYLIDSGAFGSLPIFYSVSDLRTYPGTETSDSEDCVLVMPGYKLILWFDSNFSGTYVAIDNTTGSTIIVGKSNSFGTGWTANSATSCQLFYNGNQVLQSDIVS
jgi:hypothetical protein